MSLCYHVLNENDVDDAFVQNGNPCMRQRENVLLKAPETAPNNDVTIATQ